MISSADHGSSGSHQTHGSSVRKQGLSERSNVPSPSPSRTTRQTPLISFEPIFSLSTALWMVLTNNRSGAELVLPSPRGKPLSDSTISALVRTLQIKAVPHGFRSSFRDWCGESSVDREVAEACLAHVVVNKVEATYRRTDLLERRRPVMEDWAQYVTAGLGPCALTDGNSGSRS